MDHSRGVTSKGGLRQHRRTEENWRAATHRAPDLALTPSRLPAFARPDLLLPHSARQLTSMPRRSCRPDRAQPEGRGSPEHEYQGIPGHPQQTKPALPLPQHPQTPATQRTNVPTHPPTTHHPPSPYRPPAATNRRPATAQGKQERKRKKKGERGEMRSDLRIHKAHQDFVSSEAKLVNFRPPRNIKRSSKARPQTQRSRTGTHKQAPGRNGHLHTMTRRRGPGVQWEPRPKIHKNKTQTAAGRGCGIRPPW